MPIGKMRHRLTFQQEVRTADGGGGFDLSWTKVATVWGQVEPLSGSEQIRAMMLTNPVTHRIKARYRSDLSAAQRILWGTRTFNIRSILNKNERDWEWTILAEEGVAI